MLARCEIVKGNDARIAARRAIAGRRQMAGESPRHLRLRRRCVRRSYTLLALGAARPIAAWEDLSAADRRALTEMLVDKIIIEWHPSKIDKDGRRHYLVRAIPYQDPEMEAARPKAVHEARVKIVSRV
jgi:hypothetical protein